MAFADRNVTRRSVLRSAGVVMSLVAAPTVRSERAGWSVFDFIDRRHWSSIREGTATTDLTASLRNAMSSGENLTVPRGAYSISDQINLGNGTSLIGEGRYSSRFVCRPDFNKAAQGVFDLGVGEPGAEIQHVGIECLQPDTDDRSRLVPYPPAIHAFSNPRFKLDGVRITGAMTAIDARGNAGGATLRDLEISSFEYATRWTRSLDTVIVQGVRVWPFGSTDIGSMMTSRQRRIYSDEHNVGHAIDGVSDMQISGGMIFGIYKPLELTSGFGTIVGLNLDAYGNRSVVAGGEWAMAAIHASAAAGSKGGFLYIHGGAVAITGIHGSFAASTTTEPIIVVGGGDERALLVINGGIIDTGSANVSSLMTLENAEFSVTGVYFDKVGTFTKPVIDSRGGYGNVSGNVVSQYTGRGKPEFIRMSPHSRVTGLANNTLNGYELLNSR